MFSDFNLSPIYQLEQSFQFSKYNEYNEYDIDNGQREINNNTTLFSYLEPRCYLDDLERKKVEKENSFTKLDLNKSLGEVSFNDAGFKTPNEKNKSRFIGNKSNNLGNLNTKATSFIGKKNERTDNNDFLIFENLENNKKTKFGRKIKDSLIKGNHNKYAEDNIMRKIKTYFFKYIDEELNSKLKNKNKRFLKLTKKLNENLKKDFNVGLMDTKIKNIYLNSQISSKYEGQTTKNIKLIEEIYKKMEEIDVINILELTYLDLFEEYRNNYLEQFLKHIRNEEEKKNESEKVINDYLEKIKYLCLNYEEWFKNKKGRNRTKKTE